MKDNYIKHLQGEEIILQEEIDLMQSSDMKTFIFIVVFTVICFSIKYFGRKIYLKTLIKTWDYNMLKLDIRVKILVLILANI